MIEQTFTPESFTDYAFAQVRKAANEDESTAAIRIMALGRSIEVAKASFEQSMSASIPVIDPSPTDQRMSMQAALGSDRGGAIANPEALGADMTTAPNPGKDSLSKALDDLTKALQGNAAAPADGETENVEKGVGPREASFDELDNMSWPDDMSVGRVDAEWGDDPE